MGVRFLPDFSPFLRASSSGDPDVMAWVVAVIANGGAVSSDRVIVVSDFVAAEKAAGTWALTDDYWGLWAENEPQALTSLKQRRLATAVAAPAFTTDRGYAFNGTTNYLNTGFVPGTHGVAITGSQHRLAVYERANVSANTTAIGAFSAVGNLYIRPRNGTAMVAAMQTSGAPSFTLPVADSRGWSSASRAGGLGTVRGFKNGVAMTNVTGLTPTNTAMPVALYIGANNNNGTAGVFRAAPAGFACVGAPLSDAQELAQNDNVQAWAMAIGAMHYGSQAIVLDFIAQSYEWNGVTTLAQALLCTRADAALAPDALGTWITTAANVPRVTQGRGLLIEPSSTNRLLRGRDPTHALWTKNGVTLSDSGGSPIVGTVGFTVVDVPVGTTSVAIPAGITSITAYAFGPGGNGAAGAINTRGGGGGGGGAYATIANLTVTSGSTLTVQVPAGGSGLPTFLKDNGGTTVLSADFGRNATTEAAGTQGLAANCIGSLPASGGNAGAGSLGTGNRGGGGGGGTPHPVGLNGGLPSAYGGRTGSSGGGFGGGGGATNTAPLSGTSGSASSGLGGVGANASTGTGAGAGGTPTVAAGNGTGGGGGGGGSSGVGINGGNGSGFPASLTSGFVTVNLTVPGGAGGGGGIAGNGGNGSPTGAGGGGGGASAAAAGTGGTGGSGQLLIAYGTPYSTRVTASAPGGYMAQAYTPSIPVSFTATIAGTTMNVSAVASGNVSLQNTVLGSGVAPFTTITGQIDGTVSGVGNYTVSVSQTVAAPTTMTAVPSRTPSAVMRRGTVTGPIWLSSDGGVTQSDISSQLITGRWPQVFAPFNTIPLPEWRLTFANAGDFVDIDIMQLEDKPFATSPIATIASQVTRDTDQIMLNLAAYPAWVTSDKVTVLMKVYPGVVGTGVAGNVDDTAWTWFNMRGFGASIGTVTASISSTSLTVTATDVLLGRHGLTGAGVTPGTVIFSQLSGTTGGTGTYTVQPAQTVASTAMTVVPQHGYFANATVKQPSGDEQVGVTVINSLLGQVYGFDPQTAQFIWRSLNKVAFSATASLKEGTVALNGDYEDSAAGGLWADPSAFAEAMVGAQMPGGTLNMNGFVTELVIIPGVAWTGPQMANWTKL